MTTNSNTISFPSLLFEPVEVVRYVHMFPVFEVSAAVLPFLKINKIFFGYFDPGKKYVHNENNCFFGVT